MLTSAVSALLPQTRDRSDANLGRAGGTGPAAPVLAGPIFEAPTIHFKLKPKKNTYRNVETWQVIVLHTQGSKTPF